VIYVGIAVGGALGAMARYGIGGVLQTWTATSFPIGTMSVNALGSFGLGFAAVYLDALLVSTETRAFVTIGVLGAFTTFSTFSYETLMLLQERDWQRAAWYALGSVALGLLAVLLGFWVGSATVTPRA
jgi:CrcB protein